MNRRELLRLIGAAGALPLLGTVLPAPISMPRPRLRGGSHIRPGLQLYTVRSLMAADVPGTLAKVAAAGYEEVEFAGYFDRAPAELRGILDDVGLAAPSAHVGFDALERDGGWERAIDAAHVLGHRFLVIAWIPEGLRRTLDDYRRIAERFERAGETAARAGLRFAYHNHAFEFEPIEGSTPYDILAGADPELVSLQLDLFWIRRGGRDAHEYFERFPGRFPSVHVKDMAADGSMVDVGQGVIDWAELLGHAQRVGVRHYFVEHDEPEDPLATITRSIAALPRLEG